MPEAQRMAYVGYCRDCGALNGACVDDPNFPKDTKRALAAFRRDGLRIEYVTPETVRATKLSFCNCRKREAAKLQARRQAARRA